MDEATTGFDTESRTYLHEMITSQMKEKTVLLITHHYEELDGFDKIYRLENGYLFPVASVYKGIHIKTTKNGLPTY